MESLSLSNPRRSKLKSIAYRCLELLLAFYMLALLTLVDHQLKDLADNYQIHFAPPQLLEESEMASPIRSPAASFSDDIPILQKRVYYPAVSTQIWRDAERLNVYAGATEDRLHGIYGQNFTWTKRWVKPLSSPLNDIRPEKCRGISYNLETLPAVSVIFIHSNEDIELLLRSIHSVLDRTPPLLLREIVVVDDKSTNDMYLPGGKADQYLALLPKTKSIHLSERSGIVGARLAGIRASLGEVFVVLDSHIETTPGWLEPLAYKISLDPHVVMIPAVGSIHLDGKYSVHDGGIGCCMGIIWKLMEHAFDPNNRNPERMRVAPHEYQTSPTMSGGLFAAHKQFFTDLGEYDTSMNFWGAENLEFSFRIWQCGGRLECTECSKVHHLFGGPKNYTLANHSTDVNRLRSAAVWMDDYGYIVYRVLGSPSYEILGDMTSRFQLKQQLNCHDFQWFLDNVWPESDIRSLDDLPYMGPLRSKVNSNKCLTNSKSTNCQFSDLMYFKNPQHIHPTSNDEFCLFFVTETRSKWSWCPSDASAKFDVRQLSSSFLMIENLKYKKCLTLSTDKTSSYPVTLKLCDESSDEQMWTWPKFEVPQSWKQLSDPLRLSSSPPPDKIEAHMN